MTNTLPSLEASAYSVMVEDLRHSKDWPRKAGSVAVATTLATHFANRAEDLLRREFGAFTEVTCNPKESGFTQVTYSIDYRYVQPETFPQESDILIDPAIEAAN